MTEATLDLEGSSTRRIGALVRRHWYLLRGSGPRVLEIAFWPIIQVLAWGFTAQFFQASSGTLVQAAGVLLGGVILWDVVVRSQFGMSLSFLEEMWSRNLGHLFVAPLRPLEWIGGLIVMSAIRTTLGVAPAALLAYLAYHFSVFDLGLSLIPFIACLMILGWSVGIAMCAVVLRYGLGAEMLVWTSVFALAPLSCVYYPVSVLPAWLQPVALALPSTHVFEGMRRVLHEGVFDWAQFAAALALDAVFVLIASWIFLACFRHARQHGRLLMSGE